MKIHSLCLHALQSRPGHTARLPLLMRPTLQIVRALELMTHDPAPDTAPLVLLAEDEPELARILLAYMHRDGLRTVHAADGPTALRHFRQTRPDIALLDISMPGRDGIDILKDIREHGSTPVIMVTAMSDEVSKLLSLRMGADDYIVKPFNPAEVIARIRAVLRRTQAAQHCTPIRVGELEIDAQAYSVVVNRNERRSPPIPLTLTEFRLLAHLARQPRRCFSRAELVDSCLPESDALDRVIDSHLSKLRRKLTDNGCRRLIETVRGVGYRLWPE